MNQERQRLEADIWQQAVQMLSASRPEGPIVLAAEGWHQGVIGIAASRISETYAVPTVMISLEGDHGKGSCRSYGGFNLFDALSSCGDLLDAFGGHALAAGLNIPRRNIDAFRDALTAYYEAHLPREEEIFTPDVLIDSPSLLSMSSVGSLDALEPCGAGNPRPCFCIADARLSSVSAIGGGKHTCLRMEKFGQKFDCVWFSQRATDLPVSLGDRVDAVFYPQISEFRGRRSVQLLMQEMRRSDMSDLCRDILNGADTESLYLNRGELTRIWRGLERLCPATVGINELSRIEPRLHPAKIALGLRVFHELNLAAVTPAAEKITITLRVREQKADLMQSSAWRKHHT